jgi:hypothetical protein
MKKIAKIVRFFQVDFSAPIENRNVMLLDVMDH